MGAISSGTTIGYKYFSFAGLTKVTVRARGGRGDLRVSVGGADVGVVTLAGSTHWTRSSVTFHAEGTRDIALTYDGRGPIDVADIEFSQKTDPEQH